MRLFVCLLGLCCVVLFCSLLLWFVCFDVFCFVAFGCLFCVGWFLWLHCIVFGLFWVLCCLLACVMVCLFACFGVVLL